MSDQNDEKTCMFCGTDVANRGEAYYDHLTENKACHEAWDEWQDMLAGDWAGG